MTLIELPEELQFSLDEAQMYIENRIKSRTGYATELIIPFSGGLDSSLTTYLAVNAVGPERVAVFTMNDMVTSEQSKRDGQKVIDELGVRHLDKEITGHCDSVLSYLKEELHAKYTPTEIDEITEKEFEIADSNIKPRLRMLFAHYFANLRRGLVGTGDKSEILVGFFTKYGDGAGDIFPISGLYKTQCRALAEHVGVPESIITKRSSPELVPNQTAEGDLGVEYEDIDLILRYGVDWGLRKEDIFEKLEKFGIQESAIDLVLRRVESSRHKRVGIENSIVDLEHLMYHSPFSHYKPP